MAKSITIEPGGIERYSCKIKADVDITAVVPQFAVTATDDTPETADFFNGEWLEDPVASGTRWTGKAATPRLGASGAQIELTEGSWQPWFRLEVNNEDIRRKLGTRIRMKA